MAGVRSTTLFFSIVALLIMGIPAQAICVKTSKANLRSGPGTKNQVTWEVFKYMPFRKMQEKGSWIKVKDLEGDTHWIFKNLVTSKYKCAVIKAKSANLRTGPGTKFKQPDDLPSVEKYTTFRLVKTKGKWAQIMDAYGDKYWVFRKLVWVN